MNHFNTHALCSTAIKYTKVLWDYRTLTLIYLLYVVTISRLGCRYLAVLFINTFNKIVTWMYEVLYRREGILSLVFIKWKNDVQKLVNNSKTQEHAVNQAHTHIKKSHFHSWSCITLMVKFYTKESLKK